MIAYTIAIMIIPSWHSSLSSCDGYRAIRIGARRRALQCKATCTLSPCTLPQVFSSNTAGLLQCDALVRVCKNVSMSLKNVFGLSSGQAGFARSWLVTTWERLMDTAAIMISYLETFSLRPKLCSKVASSIDAVFRW